MSTGIVYLVRLARIDLTVKPDSGLETDRVM